MDLGFDVKLTGRATRPVCAELIRELNDADLALLSVERGIKAPTIKKLRDSHHALARCLALGMSNTEASIVTGMGSGRISVLKSDPAFEELMEFYRAGKNEVIADLTDRMATVALVAADRMLEKLEDDDAPPSDNFILEAAKFAADRTGHGPQTKATNLNINVNLADRLAAGRQRAAQVAFNGHSLAPVGPDSQSMSSPVLELQANKP